MSLSLDAAQQITTAFTKHYPGALNLLYRFRDSVADLYGSRSIEVDPRAKGGYVNVPLEHAGKTYHGRVDIPLLNTSDALDLVATLKHEVLGHYGINTLTPEEKRALLDGIIDARNEPVMKVYWSDIDRRYSDASLDVRAEEVFALQCESLALPSTITLELAATGKETLVSNCIEKRRNLVASDLEAIAHFVAERLRDRHVRQLTFAHVNEIPRENARMPGRPKAMDPIIQAPTVRSAVTGVPAGATAWSSVDSERPLRRPAPR